MNIDRRKFFGKLSALGLIFAACPNVASAGDLIKFRNLEANPKFTDTPFTLGIASGDPSPDGFVIWTRLAPKPAEPHGGMVLKPMIVNWEIAEDAAFTKITQKGEAFAHPELAHSIHVEVAGLLPNRPYWYRFTIAGFMSKTGMSRTLPRIGEPLKQLRFGIVGCQHYEDGLYTAYKYMARENVDFIFHYGDYIYENGWRGDKQRMIGGIMRDNVRNHTGGEIYSLDDYRMRYALYKSDNNLQDAHAAAPFWMSFDDHEIDNNWADYIDQDNTPQEVFAFRRAAAMQAYYEHMPLRRSSMPNGSHMQMYRSAQYGDLMNVFVLDTRQYRSDQLNNDKNGPISTPELFSPQRSITGNEQEKWLFDGLAKSKTKWNLIAQQVLLLNLYSRPNKGANERVASMDQWSGYMSSRRRLLSHIKDNCPANVVTISGDAHRHYAGDLVQDNGDNKPISCEFSATSISSGGDGVGESDYYTKSVREENPQLKAMTDRRGYVVCEVNQNTLRGDLKIIDQISNNDGKISIFKSLITERGKPGLVDA